MAEALSPDDTLLAAELVLGVLDADDRLAAQRRSESDTVFAQAVDDWQRRFEPLFEEIAPIQPSTGLWNGIAVQLAQDVAPSDAAEQRRDRDLAGTGGSGDVIYMRRVIKTWRAVAVGATSIAAALLLALLLRPDPQLPPAIGVPQASSESIVAQLSDAEGGAILTARLDLTDDRLRIVPTAIPAGDGEPELWVIPADKTPRSLGLIRRDAASEILLPADLRGQFADGATLALTLEPREGAPHPAPSGTILSTARITRL